MKRDYRIGLPPKETGTEPFFRVAYVIDVNAKAPQKAAEFAYKLMTDPDSMRPVLDVIDAKGSAVRVDLSDAGYCAAAEYIAEQGRKIFTGYMNGGLWNARCMDASFLSKEQGNKAAYELLLKFGEQYSKVLPAAEQEKWSTIKAEALAMLKRRPCQCELSQVGMPSKKQSCKKCKALLQACEYILNCLNVGGEQSRQFAEEIAYLRKTIREARTANKS
jgi:hypothetical protein